MFQEKLINAWPWLGHFGNTNILACLLITTLLVISWSAIFFKSKKTSPSLPPGPRSLPLVGNLLSLDPNNLHTYFANLAQTYGPIMKLQLGQKDMVVGGSESTSNTIEFALAEMMNKPQVMQKVQEELQIVVGHNDTVEESHIHKLPYLYAVMKETLRLHAVIPLMVPHCATETSIVRGYTVPKGSRVFINAWSIHRDPSIWESPLEFIPERFLDDKLDYSGKNFNYFPFGSGRRICAGITMAERMFLLSLASLVHSFNWNLPEGVKLNLSEKFGIVLKKKLPLVAIPTPRLSKPELYQ